MKSSMIAVAAFAVGIYAQAPPNLPACGSSSCMLPAISASGCGFTDSACLCSKPGFKSALQTCIPSKCSAASDVDAFVTFINGQCTGQPGYPTSVGKSDGAGSAGSSPAAPAAPSASPKAQSSSAAAAAPKPAAPTGAAAAPASSAAAPKPAQFSGAGSSSLSLSAGVLAFAGLAHIF